MPASKDVHKLIKSLTSNEKRHFKLYTTVVGSAPNYVRLFDVLDTMEHYEKDYILKKFKGEKFVKSLHVLENYLYKKLMESLRNYYEEQSIDAQLYKFLYEAQLLEKRGFYKLAMDSLNKAERLAYKHQKFLQLLELIPYKERIIIATGRKNLVEEIESLYQQAQQYTVMIQDEMEYRYSKSWMLLMFRKWRTPKTPALLDAMHQKHQLILQNTIPSANNFYACYYYYATLYTYNYTLQEYEKAFHFQSKILELWRSNPDILQGNLSLYMTQLANYISSGILSLKNTLAWAAIEEMSTLKTKTFDEAGEQFQNVYFYKQYYYLNLKQFHEARALIPSIEEGLQKYAAKINPARQLNFYYNNTVTLFLTEAYQEAADWLNRILSITRTDEPRKDIQRFARILQLAIYYKLSSNKVLEHMFRSVYRNKALKSSMLDFEKTLLKTFKKLLQTIPNSKDEQRIFIELKQALEQLDETNKKTLGFEELYVWTEMMCQTTTSST